MFNYPNYSYTTTVEENVNDIVREELMTQYRLELEHGKDNVEFLDSLLQVIQFYCTGKEYREFYFSIHDKED